MGYALTDEKKLLNVVFFAIYNCLPDVRPDTFSIFPFGDQTILYAE